MGAFAYAWAGSWWGVGAVMIGTLILIALGLVFVFMCW